MEKTSKLLLALLLFICLLKLPYGYYQLVRFIAFVVFAWLCFQASKEETTSKLFIYGALSLLFQPFFKISLGRELWNLVDVIVGIGLVISVFKKKPL